MVVLYQHEITGASTEELLDKTASENDHAADPFTRQTVAAVLAGAGELDATIDLYSSSWPASRMAPLERSILRIAVNEILNDADIPAEVSIDEAVTLAKRYCSREAAGLINGILGKLVEESPGEPR